MVMIRYELDCAMCGAHFVKRRSDTLSAPRFCSNACKFKSMHVDDVELQCNVCHKKFCVKSCMSHDRPCCSTKCGAKYAALARGCTLQDLQTFTCKCCGKSFQKRTGIRKYEYCSRECSAHSEANKVHNGYEAYFRRLSCQYDEETARQMLDEHIQKRSYATRGENNSRYGATLSDDTRQKITTSCTGIPNILKGKTCEEFYGPERANVLATQHSEALKRGYAAGRLSPTARSHSAPIFRGVKLRSQLEQAAIEFLERRDGLVFGETLLYEDKSTRVQWTDAEGKGHTYSPDLHDLVNGVVYEVKPAWQSENPSDEVRRKMLALKASGRQCAYLTDKDVR